MFAMDRAWCSPVSKPQLYLAENTVFVVRAVFLNLSSYLAEKGLFQLQTMLNCFFSLISYLTKYTVSVSDKYQSWQRIV